MNGDADAVRATPREVANTRRALLAWFGEHARELPWRTTTDPYSIWVSEIMLQQTRVETVLAYYERFLARFPTLASLAAAEEDQVLGMWSGLGYYRRARLLHQGVRECVARYGGAVPADADARLALPGVGRYTAGAIGSIAFGVAEPIVDGNVARVLARLHRIETPLGVRVTEARLWQEAARLVIGPRPGDLNQSLMELGALVCTPRRPACESCPLRRGCKGRSMAERLPVPRKKKAPQSVELLAVVATVGERVWLQKVEGKLFGGLWSVPVRESKRRGRQTARSTLRDSGLVARVRAKSSGCIRHALSHRKLDVRVWRAVAARATAGPKLRSIALDELDSGTVGISALTHKIIEQALR